jgi:hypothetical protein
VKHALPSDEEIAHDATYQTMSKWVADRNQLILWLSKTYNDNDPIFPFYGLDGELLEENLRLYRTWLVVVRGFSELDATAKIDEILQ